MSVSSTATGGVGTGPRQSKRYPSLLGFLRPAAQCLRAVPPVPLGLGSIPPLCYPCMSSWRSILSRLLSDGHKCWSQQEGSPFTPSPRSPFFKENPAWQGCPRLKSPSHRLPEGAAGGHWAPLSWLPHPKHMCFSLGQRPRSWSGEDRGWDMCVWGATPRAGTWLSI